MKESELAKKFINYFSGEFEIYQEVNYGSIIDFVAVNDKITISVEVKNNLNFKVIEQAYFNKPVVHYSYVAVPILLKPSFAYRICEDYGIGILSYDRRMFSDDYDGVSELVKPKLNRNGNIIRKYLHNFQKQSVAGSQTDRMTPFKDTIQRMDRYVKEKPGIKLTEFVNKFDHHWSSNSSAKSCIYQYIRNGVIEDVKLYKGRLYPSDYEFDKQIEMAS